MQFLLPLATLSARWAWASGDGVLQSIACVAVRTWLACESQEAQRGARRRVQPDTALAVCYCCAYLRQMRRSQRVAACEPVFAPLCCWESVGSPASRGRRCWRLRGCAAASRSRSLHQPVPGLDTAGRVHWAVASTCCCMVQGARSFSALAAPRLRALLAPTAKLPQGNMITTALALTMLGMGACSMRRAVPFHQKC